MKLASVQVTNYRSIVDSGPVSIDEGVTVLIGKNEQGKTNFLRAMESFNYDKGYTHNDLPSHLRPSLEEIPKNQVSLVSLTLSIEPPDRAALSTIIADIEDINAINAVKKFDSSYEFTVTKTDGTASPLLLARPDISQEATTIIQVAEALGTTLLSHGERLPEFAPNKDRITQIVSDLAHADFSDPAAVRDLVRTFFTAAKALPSQDAPIQQDIAAASKELDAQLTKIDQAQAADQRLALWQVIPRFVFHSSRLDRIPNEVSVAEFIRDPETTSRGMLNLCRAAGLSQQKIQDLAATPDTAQREAYEDHYRGTISGGLNEFWTQERYEVHFRIESQKLSVSISDGTYTPRIPPSDRSEGFQWYLSFYSGLLNETGQTTKSVLLLDNPGLELHVDGQRDIKNFLEERVASDSQVIYVTHSPALIDPFNLSQLRRVELLGDKEGTKIFATFTKSPDGLDLLEPVRSAIGASLVASLILNDFNIIVEGAADKPILEGAFELFHPELYKRILINGSISESKDCFLAVFYQRANLPFVVLLDADSSAREIELQLKKLGIPEENILSLKSVFPEIKRDFAIEDVVSEDLYHSAVARAYPSQQVAKPDSKDRKRASAYEAIYHTDYGIGFNKRRVAEALKGLLKQGSTDTQSKEALSAVTAALLERLQTQSSGQAKMETEIQASPPPQE